MAMDRVGVIGAGTMGNGIAHVFARSGYAVTLCDVEQRFLDRALETIGKNLDREVAKGKTSAADKAAALKRITTALQRDQLAGCDFVIEAATEKFEIKAEIFRDLDRICGPDVLLATNTSSISITRLAAVTKRPAKIIGMHFFNPVPVMKLVEVIRGLATAQDTFETVHNLALKLDKTPVEVNDAPRICFQPRADAIAERSHVRGDGRSGHAGSGRRSLQTVHGAPHGPTTRWRTSSDSNVCLDIMRVLHDGLGDPKYRPCPLLIKMVDAGWLGKRVGEGSTSTNKKIVWHGRPRATGSYERGRGRPNHTNLRPSTVTRMADKSDRGIFILAAALGVCAGILDVKFEDLLLTALFVLAATMLLGALRHERPWRWTLLVAGFVPVQGIAYLLLTAKPYRAQIYESFLGFLTGIAGAYGGSIGRKGLGELWK